MGRCDSATVLARASAFLRGNRYADEVAIIEYVGLLCCHCRSSHARKSERKSKDALGHRFLQFYVRIILEAADEVANSVVIYGRVDVISGAPAVKVHLQIHTDQQSLGSLFLELMYPDREMDLQVSDADGLAGYDHSFTTNATSRSSDIRC